MQPTYFHPHISGPTSKMQTWLCISILTTYRTSVLFSL